MAGLEEYVQMAAMNMLAPTVSRCPPPLMHIYGCGQDVDQLESRRNSHSVSPPMAGYGRMEVVEIMYVIDLWQKGVLNIYEKRTLARDRPERTDIKGHKNRRRISLFERQQWSVMLS